MFLILAVTVLDRSPGKQMTFELIPFWSYSVPSLRSEILLNLLLFIPIGLLCGSWKSVGFTAGFSLLIELSQLVSWRGLFEFDDIIHNTLGTVIGVAISIGIKKLREKINS